MSEQSKIRPDQPGLIPALGIFSATMLVAGGVIGSGIFRKPGVMAAQVGSPEVLLGVWLLAGIISLLGTLSNAELAAMMPVHGIAGFGSFEATWAFSFEQLGFPRDQAIISAILGHAISQGVEYVLGGAALLAILVLTREASREPAARP